MAHAALVSILQMLDQIIKQDQYSNFFTKKQQFESLQDNFSFLQAFLENDPRKGEETRVYLEKMIRETAYQAQDIVEFHVSNQVSLEQQCLIAPDRTDKNRSWRLLSSVQKVYEDLQKVVEQANSIVKEVMEIKKSQRNGDLLFRNSSSHVGSPRPGEKTEMVGFDEDLAEIKDQLCGGSSKLQVVSIVGMGGIRKTTLANNLFDDPLIVYHFHVRAWTTITQNYHVREILLGLVNSMTSDKSSQETKAELAEFLYKSLKGRKYMVVLDDMWSIEAWDEVKMLFPNDNNGSRIILTTRLFDVALYANPSGPLHHLQFLDDDASWDLLREKVFAKKCCPPELEEIGKLIAKNCRGLPLAIVVVAGLLRKANRRRYHWENIARDVSLVVANNDEHFSSSILSLSYNHLPHHLKASFLYIGVFPEDYEIPVFKLINLWIAAGFLKPIGCKSLEEVAEDYLEDLVKRSLVLVTKKSTNGEFKFCSVHDLLRDLCIQKAWEEDFLNALNGIQETIVFHSREV